MSSREIEIIDSFAIIEMSPMLSPNLNFDQSYPHINHQFGLKCLCRSNCIRKGLIIIIIARDQLIFQNYISVIDTETCLTGDSLMSRVVHGFGDFF